jgi:hypothetical protein
MSSEDLKLIECFYPQLIKINAVQHAIEEKLGKEICQKIIKAFNDNTPYDAIEVDFEDIIANLVDNESKVVDTLTGMGGYGEFPIDILNYGPLYWIQAQEFDTIKYFSSYEDALSCAEDEYESYLNYSDEDENEDDNNNNDN